MARRRHLARSAFVQDCAARSRTSRAVEGAALGFFSGLVTGLIVGGIARVLTGPDSKMPYTLGLSMIGIGVAGGAIVDAIPPQC